MKILKWLDDNLEEAILVLLLAMIAIIMGIQVCARYMFRYSLTWSEEVTRYLFIWSAFISVSYCAKKGISIKLDQVVALLSGKKKALLKILSYIIELVFFLYLIPFAFTYFRASIQSGQVSPACGIPMGAVQIAPLISFILVSIRIIQKMIIEFANLRKE